MQFESLTRNNDFLRAYKKGRCLQHSDVIVYGFKKRKGGVRVGITASKKIGNAVTRNRARRVIRHALYAVQLENPGSWDIVLVARHRTPALKSHQVAEVLQRQLAALQKGAGPPGQKPKAGPGQNTK